MGGLHLVIAARRPLPTPPNAAAGTLGWVGLGWGWVGGLLRVKGFVCTRACKEGGKEGPSLRKEDRSLRKHCPSLRKDGLPLRKEDPTLLKEDPSLRKQGPSLCKRTPL